MSSVSLRSSPLRTPKMKKEETFLGKLGGTLARKKKAREVTDLQEEGKNAINSPMSPSLADLHPEDTLLEENEERTMIDPTSKEDPKFKELVKVLIDWINDVLVEDRIIVKQLEEDLFDGQVLQKLLETLAGCKLNVAEVTQSEIGQKQKLQTVLEAVQELLRPHGWALPWTVDAIHGKNLVAILHLLVSLAMHFRAPIRLPEHVSVQVVVVRKREGLLHSSHVTEELTTTTEAGRLRHPVRPRAGQAHPGEEVSHYLREQAPEQAEFGGDRTGDPVCRRRVPGSAHGPAGGLLRAPAQLLPDPRQLRPEGPQRVLRL
ncbi:beta-parvin isoform X2 [Myotis daubentonii]|uniref:beta-parvin isoform X2 n=1 Tax=Myotis daubentonii TaxID=98922 RepID=UPI00287354A7|nr:beta-parvin isoform X2 [Myotis daubentonii]